MPTLRALLLNGKVIGETFRIPKSDFGVLPTPYSYTLRDLTTGGVGGFDVYVIAEGQDGNTHHFPLARRFNDEYIPAKPSQLEQRTQQTPQDLTPEQIKGIAVHGCGHQA